MNAVVEHSGPGAAGRSKCVDATGRLRAIVCSVPDGGHEPPVSAPCLNQEVRTLMTAAAVGVAHNQKNIVPAPVVAG